MHIQVKRAVIVGIYIKRNLGELRSITKRLFHPVQVDCLMIQCIKKICNDYQMIFLKKTMKLIPLF